MSNESFNTNSTNPDLIKGFTSSPPPKPNTGNQPIMPPATAPSNTKK